MLQLQRLGLVCFSTYANVHWIKLYFRPFTDCGKPMPPYNPIFGHILFCAKLMSKLPSDAHDQYLVDQIRRALPDLGPCFYVDTYPFGPPLLLLSTPYTLYQVTQEHSLPKYHMVKEFLKPLTDGLDIVTMEGQMWKTWRGIYNTGFSLSHLMSQVPSIVDETRILSEILGEHVRKNDIFKLKHLIDNITMDVIGGLVLYATHLTDNVATSLTSYSDTRLRSQSSQNQLVNALRSQLSWLTFGNKMNPWERWHPFRPLIHWYNAYLMNSYVSRELDRRFTAYRDGERPTKSIIDLALETYLAEKTDDELQNGMDATFKKFAISQVKLFLFSGHDTTSSTMTYIFHLLAANSWALELVREEHRNILGSDSDQRTNTLVASPHLLNSLPYTVAVIKETMRLFPVVSSTRGGEPGFFVTDEQGRQFPTENFLVWSCSLYIHRDPLYWPEPDTFKPARWLVPPSDPLYPIRGAYRPFEWGPRNCIGQELAMLEMKVIMVMILGEFDIVSAYEELDQKTTLTRGSRTVNGERAYQSHLAGPADEFPCRVQFAK